MLNVEDVVLVQEPRRAQSRPSEIRLVSDALTQTAGQPAHGPAEVRLEAHLERRWGLLTVGPIAHAPVEFRVGDRLIGQALTDEDGRARLYSAAPGLGQTRTFSARAHHRDTTLTSHGAVWAWPQDRPTIVVDLDETLLESRYLPMMLWLKDLSPPMAHAHETLHDLSDEYAVIYISARARIFRRMTQAWLEEHGFPPGPILHTRDLTVGLNQRQAKFEMVELLKKQGVQVLAGIGDKAADELAFSDSKIIPIIIDTAYKPSRPETKVLPDWTGVAETLRQQTPAKWLTASTNVPLAPSATTVEAYGAAH